MAYSPAMPVWVGFAVAQYLREGDWRLVEAQFDERFPGLPPGTWADVLAETSQALAAAQNLYYTDVARPLSDVLAGEQPPASTVDVSTLMEFTDANGHVVFRTVRREQNWSDTVGQVYADMIEASQDMEQEYNWTLTEISFLPPLRFPRGARG